jgi:hypothetical protein
MNILQPRRRGFALLPGRESPARASPRGDLEIDMALFALFASRDCWDQKRLWRSFDRHVRSTSNADDIGAPRKSAEGQQRKSAL